MHKLLIIDAQNDFLDVAGAALPVPGALADIGRTAAFVARNCANLQRIIVTLDTHPRVAIERPGFWKTGTGQVVSPFTEIREADILTEKFLPRTLPCWPGCWPT